MITKTVTVTSIACASVFLLTGCGQEKASVTEQQKEDMHSAVEKVMKDPDRAQKKIDAATDMHNAKNTEALEILGEDPSHTTHTNHMKNTTMTNIPQEINMAFAKTCKGAKVTTNQGSFELKFYGEDAPVTVANFCTLSDKGFYDGVIFHRVIKDFMIQGGDPNGIGTGGPGYTFDDEIHAHNKNMTGTIAMANAGPGTNGSQFFINTKDNNFLDTKHTVFGKVVSGMDTVTAIENTQTGAMDKPVEDMVIEHIELMQ